eukprot:TRINITY_DN16627_c0_g1_i10.p1 TRINITY_DN16627_c0_g1~~TRINITY_DN16627_c0_g1_i10.p1  ORF type:complete len:398 (+),score=25.49 TRINITY_DN16627_c0_g1_i10:59-1195(+)
MVCNILFALVVLHTARRVCGEAVATQRDGHLARASLLRREAAVHPAFVANHWSVISGNSSCEDTWFDRRREANRLEPFCQSVSRTLVQCQGCCESTPGCVSIDWYTKTSHCLMYVEACTASEATKTDDGAAAYKLSRPCTDQSTSFEISSKAPVDRQTALARLNNCVVTRIRWSNPIFQIDEALLQPVIKQCKLTYLWISEAIIKFTAAIKIAHNCPVLNVLGVGHLKGDKGESSAGVAHMIKTLPLLSKIAIHDADLIESLYPTLTNVGDKVKSLALAHARLNDAELIALLGRYTDLKSFAVKYNKAAHDAVFIAAIERFPNIGLLDAKHTSLTDAGARAVLSKSKKLTHFIIEGTTVSQATKDLLKAKGVKTSYGG